MSNFDVAVASYQYQRKRTATAAAASGKLLYRLQSLFRCQLYAFYHNKGSGMLLSKRLSESASVSSRRQHQLRSSIVSTCNVQQPSKHLKRHDRPCACVQAEQQHHNQEQDHQQQLQVQQHQQPSGTSSVQPAALQLTQPSTVLHKLAAAVALSKLKTKLQQLAVWCRQHRLPQLVFGGDAGSAMAAMSMVPLLPGNGFSDLFTNRVFLAGFWAWFAAQTLKIFTKYLKKGVWDLKAIVDSGGMPSSHSALCAGITTAIAYQQGMGSSAFALAVALSSIVMYDAAGVRRHAGKQAEVLNQVIGELLEGHPVSDVKLKEVLGHTPLQVCCGAVLGVLFGIFYPTPEPTIAAQLLVAA